MKILTIRLKKGYLLAVGALVLAAILLVSPVGDAVSAAAVKRDLPIYCVQKDSKVVSVTFDAAWGADDTGNLIEILDKYDVTATFFVVGDWVDKYPEAVKALSDAGHEVMNHSNSHPHMTELSKDKMLQELNSCNDKIEAVTGVRPTLFRAPYGEYNDALVGAARSLGCYTIQWDVDSLDWKDLSATDINERVCKAVQSGSIVLFHNAAKHTPEALPSIIEYLLAQGYKIVPVSEILLEGEYDIDHTGRMCPIK